MLSLTSHVNGYSCVCYGPCEFQFSAKFYSSWSPWTLFTDNVLSPITKRLPYNEIIGFLEIHPSLLTKNSGHLYHTNSESSLLVTAGTGPQSVCLLTCYIPLNILPNPKYSLNWGIGDLVFTWHFWRICQLSASFGSQVMAMSSFNISVGGGVGGVIRKPVKMNKCRHNYANEAAIAIKWTSGFPLHLH